MTANTIVYGEVLGAGLLADIAGMWRRMEFPAGLRRWQL